MSKAAPALLLLSLAVNAGAASAGDAMRHGVPAQSVPAWKLKASPHFEIYHEAGWAPNSIAIEMEKLYSSMRLNLSMFAPWMVKEKTKVYIHSSRETYLKGEFEPPSWSKGLAFTSRKTIVVYDSGDLEKLRAVIAHELTHLYFETYFAEKLKYPPKWLNEGLAVMMEDSSHSAEGGPWTTALKYMPRERFFGMRSYFASELSALNTDQKIGDWYLQAFGIVKHLYSPAQRLQFRNFCEKIRDGAGLETALWEVYRVRDADHFEKKWAAWLDLYRSQDAPGFGRQQPSASFNFQPVKLSSFGFTNFGGGK
ncbi:MAG: peptidase MA family metallohydrolase [Elusimicrobiales bacterium]|nr:peptidase MA family metallohydrolase [Elusimicrobiales bacterium]